MDVKTIISELVSMEVISEEEAQARSKVVSKCILELSAADLLRVTAGLLDEGKPNFRAAALRFHEFAMMRWAREEAMLSAPRGQA
jgi:hypothetical protein